MSCIENLIEFLKNIEKDLNFLKVRIENIKIIEMYVNCNDVDKTNFNRKIIPILNIDKGTTTILIKYLIGKKSRIVIQIELQGLITHFSN